MLIIDCQHDINLHYFKNIHYLCIKCLSDELLIKINSDTLPYLEHLSIRCVPNFTYYRYNILFFMGELSLIIQSLIDSKVDDMILDLVYEIHSSIKGIPQEQSEIINKLVFVQIVVNQI